ncbi:MAG: PAS domain S-box protein [Bacteroidales bacterium]|nr:MAG: PAS domain S-box protein [Bacteroidales bacterium]
MKKKIKILHLEDSSNDSELIRTLIEIGEIEHEYFLADNEKDFLNILETEDIDIILSDYNLPDYNGNEALKVSRERYSQMPFIFVSGAMGEDRAIDAMLNGATDYVLKNKLERLVPAINRAINEHELTIKQKHAEDALHDSERKYKDFVNEVNDGYFITNNHGKITFANISMAKILGFKSPEELSGRFFTDFNKIGNIKGVNYTFKKIIENKERFDGLELEVLRIDGNIIHIEIKAIPVLEYGKITGMQGVVHNITERKLAEIDLKEKNEQIEAQNEKYIIINKELAFQNEEKVKRAAELVIANTELAFQNEEKEKRADELIIANIQKEAEEKYKLLLEEKNLVITDSIIYARHIQRAILPRKEDIHSSLPESFIIYKPKDIVSGDFYFFHKKKQTVFIVAADCTGHGVPGALMSMMGSEIIRDAVLQTSDTSEILRYLNNGIKNSLHQWDENELVRDGMDIAICSINTRKRNVQYSGARIPFWLIRKGMSYVEEIKGTREVIGGSTPYNQCFENHELMLSKGDTFYLSTDGYADQFNGQNKRKLMKNNFRNILLEIQNKSMPEQEKHLENFIENWREGTRQIDDILVIGIRL